MAITNHYQVKLPNGEVRPMTQEQLDLYNQGKWDPMNPQLTPEQKAMVERVRALAMADIPDE